MLSGYCKICCVEFNADTLSHPLFTDSSGKRVSNVGKMFIKCIFAQIKPTNGLFDRLCTECTSKLLEFYKFRLEAIDTNNKFAQLFNKGQGVIEEETIDLNIPEGKLKEEIPNDADRITLDDDPIEESVIDRTDERFAYSDEDNQLGGIGYDVEDKLDEVYLDEELLFDNDIVEKYEDTDYSSFNIIETETIKTEVDEYEDGLDDNIDFIGNSTSIERSLNDSEGNQWCELCNIYIDGMKDFREHNKNIHYSCDRCDKLCKGCIELKSHIQETHGNGLICRYCGKKKSCAKVLARHESRHTKDGKFVCDLCDKRYYDLNDMKVHFLIHTDERPYVCEYCGKRFRVHCHMVAHLESHNKEKMFKCADCDKSFQRSQSLKEHRERVHLLKNICKCSLCGKVEHLSRKTRHISNHKKHGEEVIMLKIDTPVKFAVQ